MKMKMNTVDSEAVGELSSSQLEILNERKNAAEKRLSRGKPFIKLTEIGFRRVILHIVGEFVNMNSDLTYNAAFVCEDGKSLFYPAHFESDGRRFSLTANMMCAENNAPPSTGKYYLTFFTEKNNSITVSDLLKCRVRYPCFIDAGLMEFCSENGDNPLNFKLRRSDKNLFFAVSHEDIDSCEYYLAVRYVPPGQRLGFFARQKKYWSGKLSLMKKDFEDVKVKLVTSSFKFFRRFAKENGNIILFSSASRAELGGNEKFIHDRMIERGLDRRYRFRYDFKASIKDGRSVFGMLRFVYYLATSDIIIIDDYHPEIYKVDYGENQKILQVWHACGAFKSLGFERLGKPGAPPFNTRVHKCYTHVPVSSYHSAKHHAEGFGIPEDRFYPVGIPRTDIFFDKDYSQSAKKRMYEQFPSCSGANKVYLYAPTFRGENALNARFPFDKIDFDRWGEFLRKEGSVLIVKMHPFVKEKLPIPEKYSDCIIDASEEREVNDILFIIDVLITDYSSIIYETSLLRKPMLFYAFDQKYYEATRDFYEPYEDLVPGKITSDFDELMEALENENYEYHKMDAFINKNFTYTDGKATDRVIDRLIIGIEPENEQKGKVS